MQVDPALKSQEIDLMSGVHVQQTLTVDQAGAPGHAIVIVERGQSHYSAAYSALANNLADEVRKS